MEPITRSERLLVTPSQAAKLLSICERTLFSLAASGQILRIKIGRAVRYSPDDLQRWIDERKESPGREQNPPARRQFAKCTRCGKRFDLASLNCEQRCYRCAVEGKDT